MRNLGAHDDGFGRRFPVLWGMLTVTYAAAVAYRAISQSHLPGLRTFASLSAIAAVWLSFFEQIRSKPHRNHVIILTIAATILLNTGVIITAAWRARSVPVEQVVFTAMFAYVLVSKLHYLRQQNSTPAKRPQ